MITMKQMQAAAKWDTGMAKPESEPPVEGSATGSALAVRAQLLHRISNELDRAYAKHGRGQWGRHEFYAILKEEVDELWDAIKTDASQPTVMEEAMQVAAMVFRYYETGDRYREPNAALSGAESEHDQP